MKKRAKQGGLPPWMPASAGKAGKAGTSPSGAHGGEGGKPASRAGAKGKADDTGRVKRPGKAGGPPPWAKPDASRQAGPRPHRGGPRHDPHAALEAQRYANPIVSREAILQLLRESDGPLLAEDIARAFRLRDDAALDALSKRLNAMARDGELLMNRRGGFAPAAQLDLLQGSVTAHPDGFGFFKPDDGSDDLFLPPPQMRKVLHGDRALASVSNVDARGRREGAIVEVLQRRVSRVVGRVALRAGIAWVTPDDRRVHGEILIPNEERRDARDGQLVVCEIISYAEARQPMIGRILVVLGDALTASKVVEMAIYGHQLPHEFPPEVLDEALAVPQDVPDSEIARRVDLRKLPLVTIDGEDAKDFDDAVYCETDAKGFRLWVAIADVSHYVRPGKPLDDEAQNRATSVYFPGYVVPMLPETLSNGICSLNPKVDRLCFVCEMRVDFDGQTSEAKFYEAVMRSQARLTYTQVWKAVGEKDEEAIAQIGAQLPAVQRLHQLYGVLAKARSKRGAIEFESGEVRFVLDAKGEVIQAGMLERNDAHKLIEECMIAANVEAARAVLKRQAHAPFRIHDKPPETKYADLLEYLKEFGLMLPSWGKVTPKDFTKLLKKVRERPDAALLETVLLRSQSLAIYSTENIGHFGLALEGYAHFTSPIRRYPDLLLHRALKAALIPGSAAGQRYESKDMAALCLMCSEKERRADEAEREVDERFRSAWMEQHVGSEFDGVVSGVTSFGLFVELNQSKVNGMVHVTMLPHDYYHFDPLRKSLSGERKGSQWRLGDAVRVLVLRASVEDRRIDFKLVTDARDAQGKRKKKAWAE